MSDDFDLVVFVAEEDAGFAHFEVGELLFCAAAELFLAKAAEVLGAHFGFAGEFLDGPLMREFFLDLVP